MKLRERMAMTIDNTSSESEKVVISRVLNIQSGIAEPCRDPDQIL